GQGPCHLCPHRREPAPALRAGLGKLRGNFGGLMSRVMTSEATEFVDHVAEVRPVDLVHHEERKPIPDPVIQEAYEVRMIEPCDELRLLAELVGGSRIGRCGPQDDFQCDPTASPQVLRVIDDTLATATDLAPEAIPPERRPNPW